jgi:diguanylate cyclase (GGDEF)-like protein
MSITDKLTGIYNRGRFEYVLGLWIKNMRHDPFCMIMIDIDDFKKINDNFGHNAGDQVLFNTTTIISANIRDDDIFARWGGEEFVILFGSTTINRATELAERLRVAISNNEYGEAGKITISIGVAQYRRTESLLEFINRADSKMYEAKKAGKNKVISEELATAGLSTGSSKS